MQRFRAASFGALMASLGRTTAAINTANAFGVGDKVEADRKFIRETLEESAPSLSEFPLSPVLRSQFDRLVRAVDHSSGAELSILVQELGNNLMVGLSSAWFLMISADRREYYEQRQPPFGEAVADAFLGASSDIAAASRCFALDEWTACVFHLMRILEHGLRKLAEIVQLPPEAAQHENWKNIIDQIEKKIREMESLPKSQEKVAKVQRLSEAAAQFRWFKDAWRNHVAHAHATYDNHTGPLVWTHVRSFMQQLATF